MYLLLLSTSSQEIIEDITDFQDDLIAIENLKILYEDKTAEAPFNRPLPKTQAWPQTGSLTIEDLSIRYTPFETQPTLKKLNLRIKAGEKVAVIGHPGAGKSTLILAILRILEARDRKWKRTGKIEVDGVDVANIGLHILRRSIGTIPQDPLFFRGTLQSNLDPFGIHSKEEMFSALNKLRFFSVLTKKQKKEIYNKFNNDFELPTVRSGDSGSEHSSNPGDSIPNKNGPGASFVDADPQPRNSYKILGLKIAQNGSDLTPRQKQLICLARMILRKPKILLIDEVSRRVDKTVERVLKRVLRTEFRDTTVIRFTSNPLAIAHFERIIVMEEGRIMEQGTAKELMLDSDGYLCQLVNENEEKARKQVLANFGIKMDAKPRPHDNSLMEAIESRPGAIGSDGKAADARGGLDEVDLRLVSEDALAGVRGDLAGEDESDQGEDEREEGEEEEEEKEDEFGGDVVEVRGGLFDGSEEGDDEQESDYDDYLGE